jgi:PBSX family phage terminase large subunit
MAKRRVTAKAFKFKPFSDKQAKVLTWWTQSTSVNDKYGIIADGAIRSGKTLSMSLSYVMWAMESFDGQNFGMAGKTIGSFRRNVLFLLKLMLTARGYRFVDHRADNLLEVTKGDKVNYFYIFGGKDDRSQDLIQGITLAGMFFDEVALMPQSFVNQAAGRLSVEGSKIWFNCNPDGPYHWFKTEGIDTAADKDLIYLHFDMDDNLTLSETIKQRYRSNFTGVFYKRYILGLWVVAEGIIYDMFNQERHTFKRPQVYTDKDIYVSIDYGTQNATVFLLWRKTKQGKWHCVKEYYYSGRDTGKQKTDKEFADELESFLGDIKPKRIIVDPSAASFIAELKQRGYKIKKANNKVLDGIRYVGSLLNTDEIAFSPDCINTFKEFNSYIWDEKATERGEDAPVKQHDHAMDAVRYFAYTIIRKSGKGMKIMK